MIDLTIPTGISVGANSRRPARSAPPTSSGPAPAATGSTSDGDTDPHTRRAVCGAMNATNAIGPVADTATPVTAIATANQREPGRA